MAAKLWSVIQRYEVFALLPSSRQRLIQRDLQAPASTFVELPGASPVDQDAAHQLRRDGEEVRM
jgi:hypothetical protein